MPGGNASEERREPWGPWRLRGEIRSALLLAGCAVAQPSWPWLLAGAALLLPGMALHVRARGCLHFAHDGPSTSGPYRFTRNPFYLATLLVDLGIGLATGLPEILVLYLPAWLIVYGSTMRREERLLEAKFGDPFRRYRAAVPRLLPRLRPAAGLPPSPGFSWSNPTLAHGLEATRLVSYLFAPIVVWAVHDLVGRLVPALAAPLPEGLSPAGLYAAAAAGKGLEWGLRLRWSRWKRRAGAATPSGP